MENIWVLKNLYMTADYPTKSLSYNRKYRYYIAIMATRMETGCFGKFKCIN